MTRLRQLEESLKFRHWAERVGIKPEIDVFPLDRENYRNAADYLKRLDQELQEFENFRYFRGRWYLVDP